MEDKNAHLFIKTYKKRPLVINGGSGSYLFTKDRRYLDFLSGISINNLGYSNQNILKNITNQLKSGIIHPSNYYYTQTQIDLALKLIKISTLKKVFFASSGTEANEAALSFIAEYSKNVPFKNEIILFKDSFFGRTYGSQMLARGGSAHGLQFKLVPFNDNEGLKNAISDSTLGIALELVLGHGGVRKIDPAVIKTIKEISAEKDLIIMIDEVQTGLGRTGQAFLFQEFDINPDLVTLGKSLGGGLPLSAVLASERVAEVVQPGSYGCTMGGNSIACAAGIVMLDYLRQKNNLDEIRKKGAYILKKLKLLSKQFPERIHEARCYGLMCGLEIADGSADAIATSCFHDGLLIDTVNKNVLRMLPQFTISYDEINIAMSILEKALEKNYEL